ncbi:MAG: hypothetical protein AABW99_05325, partial [archaeon]
QLKSRKLNPEQEITLKEIIPFIKKNSAIHARRAGIKGEDANEFLGYVLGQAPLWIISHNPRKALLKTYVEMKIKYAVREFRRIELQQKLGIPRTEVGQLMGLVREMSKQPGNIRLEERLKTAAKKAGINDLEKALELWQAFGSLNKTKSIEETSRNNRF